MDGVLADVYAQFTLWHQRDTGILKLKEETIGMREFEAFPAARNMVFTPGFFRTLPPIEGGIATVKDLMDVYDVYIVSAATEFPQCLSEKMEWLQEHLPFIPWQKIVFCGSKQIVRADIMIDDHFKNLDHFEGKTFLFDQPHNHLADPGRHERVLDWKTLRRRLLPV